MRGAQCPVGGLGEHQRGGWGRGFRGDSGEILSVEFGGPRAQGLKLKQDNKNHTRGDLSKAPRAEGSRGLFPDSGRAGRDWEAAATGCGAGRVSVPVRDPSAAV